MAIVAAADGSALGNPGPAGWAWFINDEQWKAGGWKHATNNQAELMAVLSLLNETEQLTEPLIILSDSKYVIDSLTKWLPGWKRKGWRKADGKPVLNRELFESLDSALQGRNIRFEWVKGHSGHPMNEKVDTIARETAVAFQRGENPQTGPGYLDTSPSTTPSSAAPETLPSTISETVALFTATEEELFQAPRTSTSDAEPSDTITRIKSLEQRSFNALATNGRDLLHPQYREVVCVPSPANDDASALFSSNDRVITQDGAQVEPGLVILTTTSERTPGAVQGDTDTPAKVVWTSVWIKRSGEWLLAHRHISQS